VEGAFLLLAAVIGGEEWMKLATGTTEGRVMHLGYAVTG
jgi:hypothetical protein